MFSKMKREVHSYPSNNKIYTLLPGGRKLEGPKKSSFFGWPKIKGAELGEGGRKLKGPKIKGSMVNT